MAGKKYPGPRYPRHLRKTKGRGIAEDQASGFLRPASEMMDDVRQGRTHPDFADITPGFGTYHPQDVVVLGALDDPKAVENSRPKDDANYTKAELEISDGEVKLSIQEGRAPRRGF